MKAKNKNLWFIFLVLAIFMVVNTALGGTKRQDNDPIDLPPPPTPGPEPTAIPESYEGAYPVTTKEEAVDHVIQLDRAWTIREEPLNRDELLEPGAQNIIIEGYDTWQEASNLYDFGVRFDEMAKEPVWVVVIKGDVIVDSMESQGVTYIFSQKTGYLLSMSNSVSE